MNRGQREIRNFEITYLYEILGWSPERIGKKFNLTRSGVYLVLFRPRYKINALARENGCEELFKR